MSAGLQAVREDLRALARMYGAGGGDYKGLCLAVIDRAAACATNLHREIPVDVLGHLTRAMHAAGRENVAGVIEEVEGALALLSHLLAFGALAHVARVGWFAPETGVCYNPYHDENDEGGH